MQKTTLSNIDITRIAKGLKMDLWCGMRDEFTREVLQKYNFLWSNFSFTRVADEQCTKIQQKENGHFKNRQARRPP